MSYRCPAPPPRCVYWNESAQGWLGDGCELVSVGETNVTCKCNRKHLTYQMCIDKCIHILVCIFQTRRPSHAPCQYRLFVFIYHCVNVTAADLTDFSVLPDIALLLATLSAWRGYVPPEYLRYRMRNARELFMTMILRISFITMITSHVYLYVSVYVHLHVYVRSNVRSCCMTTYNLGGHFVKRVACDTRDM